VYLIEGLCDHVIAQFLEQHAALFPLGAIVKKPYRVRTRTRYPPGAALSITIFSAPRHATNLIGSGADWLFDNCSAIAAEEKAQLRVIRITLR
jgi:hypothetical protein